MPGTLEARRLTEAHRRAQVANERSFLAEFLAAWGLLDLANLDLATPSWLRVVMRLIEVFREISANLARDYVREHRALELPDTSIELPELVFDAGSGPQVTLDLSRRATRVPRQTPGRPRNPIPLRPDPARGALVLNWRDRDPQVEASLRATGPQTAKYRIGRGETPEAAARNASVQAAGAAIRHVGNGGRDTALTLIKNDQAAVAFIRVTGPNPCAFCAMLASRGPVYRSEWAAGGSNRRSDRNKKDPRTAFIGNGEFKVHDNCMCRVIGVYSRTAEWPGRGREFQQLWNNHIQGRFSGDDAIRAWRRLIERPEVFLEKQGAKTQKRRAA